MRFGTIAGYAAFAVGLLYAALSLYWSFGGEAFVDTVGGQVGGQVGDLARRGGAAAVALGLGATLVKIAGSAVAFALARTRGRVHWILLLAALAGFLLIIYGAVLVAVGALTLTGAIDPGQGVDWTALRWHVVVWDLWFLVWGILLAGATIAFRKRSFVEAGVD